MPVRVGPPGGSALLRPPVSRIAPLPGGPQVVPGVAIDAVSSAAVASGTSVSTQITVAPTATMLLVFYAWATNSVAPSSVTYGSDLLNLLDTGSSGVTGTDRSVSVFYLMNPTPGTRTVTANLPFTTSMELTAVSLHNADIGVLPVHANTNGTNTTVTLTPTQPNPGGLEFTATAVRTTTAPTVGGNGQLLASLVGGTNNFLTVAWAGSGSTSHTWSVSDVFGAVSVSVNPLVTYPGAVVTDGPLAYWRMDDPSGTVMRDATQQGRNGVYSGSPTLNVAGLVPSNTNTAASFTGSTQYATVPHDVWMDINLLTYELIFTPSATTTNLAFLARDDGSANRVFALYADATGKVAAYYWNAGGTGPTTITGTTTLVAGTRYHILLEFDGTNAVIYVNNAVDATGACAGGVLINAVDGLTLANNQVHTATLGGGTLDEVAVYGFPLSAARIAAHFAAITASTAITATGSVTLGGSTTAVAAATVAGSITLGGSLSAQAAATATGSITLGGSTTARAPGAASGSITLGGSATGAGAATATGSITLDGTATAVGSGGGPTATGSITLGGSTSAAAAATTAGSITLGGSVTARGVATASGSITLGGSVTARGAATASGSITLGGSVTAQGAGAASGSITLGGLAQASLAATATGSIVLSGTAAAVIAIALLRLVYGAGTGETFAADPRPRDARRAGTPWAGMYPRIRPIPTQKGLLLFMDGRVIPTESWINDPLFATADDHIAGGTEWVGTSSSWQAIVLQNAGYTLATVT